MREVSGIELRLARARMEVQRILSTRERATTTTSRRNFTLLLFLAALLPIRGTFAAAKKSIAAAARFVRPNAKWDANNFYEFVKALPPDARLILKKSVHLLKEDAKVGDLKSANQDAKDIQKRMLWLSSNVFAYPFKDASKVGHHQVVMWAAKESNVSLQVVDKFSTFELEKELYKLLFAQLWNKLTPVQRQALLAKIDPNGSIKDRAAVAAMGGAAALAALSATVAFTGFAFYTTMSLAIAAVASAVGVVLPFATYTAAASVVGVLAGPVGWAIMGVSALGGLVFAGRANVQKTTAAILQIHALKVEALIADGAK